MAHLLAQPQQKLQLNCKTNVTQQCQKINLYGSLTTKELKKVTYIQMGRRGRDEEMQRGSQRRGDAEWGMDMEQAAPHPCVVDKNKEGYLQSKGSQPYTRQHSPGFQCQEDKSP